jgi:hypothetical protein
MLKVSKGSILFSSGSRAKTCGSRAVISGECRKQRHIDATKMIYF